MATNGWYSDWYANGWYPSVWFAPADESGVPPDELTPPLIEAELTLQKPRKHYVRRKKQVYLFNTAEEADAFIDASEKADQAIAKAQATSKAAKKKIRRKIYDATGIEPESVSIDHVSSLVSLYGLQFDVPSLIAQSDFETFMQVALMAQAIEEEEIEMLLLA
jgi:hypothetical protein